METALEWSTPALEGEVAGGERVESVQEEEAIWDAV